MEYVIALQYTAWRNDFFFILFIIILLSQGKLNSGQPRVRTTSN